MEIETGLTADVIIGQIRQTLQFPGYHWSGNLYHSARENGDISGAYFMVRKSGHVFTVVPTWETFSVEFAQMFYDLAGIRLKPLRDAVTGEQFFERVRPTDPRSRPLASRFHCPPLGLGTWPIHSEREIHGKAMKISEAFDETRSEYLAATATLENIAARILYWPKSGPNPTMPGRYGPPTRNMRRIIALRILGKRDAMRREYEALREYFHQTPDARFKRRHSVFVERFSSEI